MNIKPIFLAGILLLLLRGPVLAEPNEQPKGAESAEYFERAIASTQDTREKALLHKQLGDLYVLREDYGKASGEFMQALTLAPAAFSEQDRLSMAITISWAGRYDDAVAILRSILAEDPKNRDARIHLARTLSWASKLDEAEKEADDVLKEYPENQDALLVKANVLRWRGEARASIPVYEKALAQEDNFDARIGLAYAYLDIGEKEKATEIGKALKPQYAAQNKELASFKDAFCGVRASHIGIGYSYYEDSDENRVNRVKLSYGFWISDWESEFSSRFTDAKDPVRHEKSQDLWFTTHTAAGRFGVGAGIGVSKSEGSGAVLVAQANADTTRGWWTVGVSATRETLTDTAELITNRIVRTGGTLKFSESASERLSFTESYTHSGYSDNNDADDVRLGVRYEIPLAPVKIATGYRFRYWDFRRQSRSGYFDPSDFISHEVFLSLYTESNGYYAYLEPYVGHESFTRYGESNNKFFSGFSASAGWKMKKCTSFEITGEGGNYAGGTAAGFNYYQAGLRLLVNF